MHYGLNATADPVTYGEIAKLGFTLVRCEPWAAPYAQQAGLSPLVIVFSPDVPDSLAGLDVELWNEPDGTVDQFISPVDYAALVPAFIDRCAEIDARPWIGAISNLHQEALSWLRQMFTAAGPVPDHVGVTVHRYHPAYPVTFQTPHRGFSSRDAEVAALKGIIGWHRPWGMSEYGYHTAPQVKYRWLPKWWPSNRWNWTDDQVAENVAQEWGFWQRHEAAFAVLYQINDGPTNTGADRYGIRRYNLEDPWDWKPVAHSIPLGVA